MLHYRQISLYISGIVSWYGLGCNLGIVSAQAIYRPQVLDPTLYYPNPYYQNILSQHGVMVKPVWPPKYQSPIFGVSPPKINIRPFTFTFPPIPQTARPFPYTLPHLSRTPSFKTFRPITPTFSPWIKKTTQNLQPQPVPEPNPSGPSVPGGIPEVIPGSGVPGVLPGSGFPGVLPGGGFPGVPGGGFPGFLPDVKPVLSTKPPLDQTSPTSSTTKKREVYCHTRPNIKYSNPAEMEQCRETPAGDSCNVKCLPGHFSKRVKIDCMADGEWDTHNVACEREIVCRDEKNNKVDWFILYKLPVKANSKVRAESSDYLLQTSRRPNWNLFREGFTTTDWAAPLKNTIDPLSQGMVTYGMYNDQPFINAPSKTHGHSKGVLARSRSELNPEINDFGFFLSHSLPRFPLSQGPAKNQWSHWNGQLFMCISFEATQSNWDTLRGHVNNLKPRVYEKSADWDLQNGLGSPNVFNFQGLGQNRFTFFSKSKTNVDGQRDIYEDIISPYYNGVKLTVATWWRGSGTRLAPTYGVSHVHSLWYKNDIYKKWWPWSKEHSKWAVSQRGEPNQIFCIADLNRMQSQRQRYGGAVCVKDKMDLIDSFRELVDEKFAVGFNPDDLPYDADDDEDGSDI